MIFIVPSHTLSQHFHRGIALWDAPNQHPKLPFYAPVGKRYGTHVAAALNPHLAPAPVWPEGCTLRPIVAKQDDQMVNDFIQAAFDRPWRVSPSFESWRDYMMRPDHFKSDLWFLLFDGEELIGAALCYDYTDGLKI
jgi:hypothetical protein